MRQPWHVIKFRSRYFCALLGPTASSVAGGLPSGVVDWRRWPTTNHAAEALVVDLSSFVGVSLHFLQTRLLIKIKSLIPCGLRQHRMSRWVNSFEPCLTHMTNSCIIRVGLVFKTFATLFCPHLSLKRNKTFRLFYSTRLWRCTQYKLATWYNII